MSLLIDGYNLLYVSGILGRGRGPGGFEQSRLALLNFLAESLDPADAPRTTVVFDAQNAPWGVPRVVQHRGITVRFAAEYEEADDLLEELIRADTSPRRLVVVSSDHRIQRAARRRRAKAFDSDVWYSELIHQRRERLESAAETEARPAVPLLEEDVNYWLRQFGGESVFTELLKREGGLTPRTPAAEPPAPESSPDEKRPTQPTSGRFDDIENPFPPGYGEDLLDNEGF